MPLKAEVEQANRLIECVQCKFEVRVPPSPTAQAAPTASPPPPTNARVEPWWRRLLRRGK